MIPGGGREKGESLEECCKRELMEETGSVVLPHTHFLTLEEYYGEYFFKSHYFLCRYKGECEMNLTETELTEGMEPRWVDFGEALQIFGNYKSLENTSEMKSGMYYREYLALNEVQNLKI
jgi:8-oxo-dGTP pyrophosphatase MutT (NUDIX family)